MSLKDYSSNSSSRTQMFRLKQLPRSIYLTVKKLSLNNSMDI